MYVYYQTDPRMNITQIALGFITTVMVSTMSYMVIMGKVQPDAYAAGMMGVLAVWLRVDTDGDRKPDIQDKTTIAGNLPTEMLAKLTPRVKL